MGSRRPQPLRSSSVQTFGRREQQDQKDLRIWAPFLPKPHCLFSLPFSWNRICSAPWAFFLATRTQGPKSPADQQLVQELFSSVPDRLPLRKGMPLEHASRDSRQRAAPGSQVQARCLARFSFFLFVLSFFLSFLRVNPTPDPASKQWHLQGYSGYFFCLNLADSSWGLFSLILDAIWQP